MKKRELKTTKWDVVDYLKTDENIADYLEAAMEDGHPAVIATAIGNIARAKGMTHVARKAGIGRVGLYKALSANGNPEFATVLKVLKALGIKLHATT
jgi:probable addiction module antidote protein